MATTTYRKLTIQQGSDTYVIDATYPSLEAVENGTAESVVTTGEKYIWGNKQDEIDYEYDSQTQALSINL